MQQVSPQPEAAPSPTRLRGFIKKPRPTLGYCFVRAGGIEYFLHSHQLNASPAQMVHGALVEFTPMPTIPGEKSPRAIDAIVISEPRSIREAQ